jgi:ParB family transcriptional regulator, chromosome partitioning protein
MATTVQKITLSPSRDIPFNKLVLSQSNVRRVKAGVSIKELAEDIARRGLLQGLSVRSVVDEAGAETDMFEIPAGGRRYRALELLVKQKRLAKTAPVPCVVREGGIAEEDSLAENVQRTPLHPLDQFRGFLALRERGQSEEEIAAAFFVSVGVVKQLASVSPALLDVYAEDGMTLDQLMAFTVASDHERQGQVFERLKTSYDKQPYVIRRMLTEGAVRASDKRAQFIGIEAYVEAGGTILRDLFQGDDGGWLQDVALVNRLVAEKLEREAEPIRAEGWKWFEVAPDFAYGHSYGLRQLRGEPTQLTPDEQSARDALQAEYDRLEETNAEADELSEEVDRRIAEIETAFAGFDERPMTFDPAEIVRAGAFVSIDGAGRLRVERGYVRPEDETPVEREPDAPTDDGQDTQAQSEPEIDGQPEPESRELEEDEGLKPLPDRLMTELTAHRTLALRQALGEQSDLAFLAALHGLCVKAFYRYALDSCLEIDLKSVGFGAQAPALNDAALAVSFHRRHQAWMAALPDEPTELWDALTAFDTDSRQALFAHCVSLAVNAVFETHDRRPRALAHADRLAEALSLDMVAAGWSPTIENYLGRVSKARILEAVREAKGEGAAELIQHLKKREMAERAQELLAGSGWLPEPLRTPRHESASSSSACHSDPASQADTAIVETTANGDETAMVETGPLGEDESVANDSPAVAAE